MCLGLKYSLFTPWALFTPWVMFTLLTSLTSCGHVQTNSPDVELCALTGGGNAKRLLSYCSWAVLPLTGSNDIKQYNRVNETLLSYYCTALMLTSSGDPQKMQTSPSCCFPAHRWWGPSNTTLMIGGGGDITLALLSCTQVVGSFKNYKHYCYSDLMLRGDGTLKHYSCTVLMFRGGGDPKTLQTLL